MESYGRRRRSDLASARRGERRASVSGLRSPVAAVRPRDPRAAKARRAGALPSRRRTFATKGIAPMTHPRLLTLLFAMLCCGTLGCRTLGGCGDGCAAPATDCTACGHEVGRADSCGAGACSDAACACQRRPWLGKLFGCVGCSCEVYWHEWYNDPPACCDPCDDCGNYRGSGCATCGPGVYGS
jgi:hypothetical protein